MRKIIFGVVLASCAAGSFGQAPAVLRLSLKEAVRAALSPGGSRRLRIAEESAALAQARADESRAALLPRVGGSADGKSQRLNLGTMGLDGLPLPRTADVHDYNLRVSARGEWGVGDAQRWRAARAGARASQKEEARVQDAVAAQVARLYLAAARGAALIKEAQENVATAQALLDLARHRASVGKGTELEVTRAHARLMTDEEDLAAAQIEQTRAQLGLLQAMGRGLDAVLELTEEPETQTPPEIGLEEALAQGLSARPELRAQEDRVSRARLLRSASRWERLPSLALYGDYGPDGAAVNDTVNTYVAGVSLKLPFFGDGLITSRQKQSAADFEGAQAELEDARSRVELEIREAAESLRLAAKREAAAEEGLLLSRQELEQARRRYEAGVADNLAVVEAQARLAQAERRWTNALFGRRQARVELWLAAGIIREKLR